MATRRRLRVPCLVHKEKGNLAPVATLTESWLEFFRQEILRGESARLVFSARYTPAQPGRCIVLQTGRAVRGCGCDKNGTLQDFLSKHNSPFAMRRNGGRAFFSAPSTLLRLSDMPMQLLRCVGVVVDVYGDLLAFLERRSGPGSDHCRSSRNDAFWGRSRRGRFECGARSRRIVSVLWIGRFARQGDDRRLGTNVFGGEDPGSSPETDGFFLGTSFSTRHGCPSNSPRNDCGAECTAALSIAAILV